MPESVQNICDTFVSRLRTVIEAEVVEQMLDRVKTTVARSAIAGGMSFGPAMRKAAKAAREFAGPPKKERRKGPIQLCPAPRCPNRAAPVFGMLCTKHKDTPKSIVKKWREARRAKAARS